MRAKQAKKQGPPESVVEDAVPERPAFAHFRRLQLDETCTSDDIIMNWRISDNTLRKWKAMGCRPLTNDTKSEIWLVSEVVEFLRRQRDSEKPRK